MTQIEKVKILIVGLTAVLSFISFSKDDFIKEITQLNIESGLKF